MGRKRYTLEFVVPVHGRGHRAEVRMLDSKGLVEFTHRADLMDAKEREKLAELLAPRMKLKPGTILKKIEKGFNEGLNQRNEESTAAGTGGPPPDAYLVQDGRVCRRRQTREGEVIEALCNFAARITDETAHDDGAEVRLVFGVEGELPDGTPLPRKEVTAADFAAMNWTLPSLGHARCRERWPGRQGSSPGRTANAKRSGCTTHHLRPHRLAQVGQDWVYLHTSGAIGPIGPVIHTVETGLPDVLSPMILPNPPEGASLTRAVRASLRLAGIAPHRITMPLLGAVFLAPLSVGDVSLFLVGPSGAVQDGTSGTRPAALWTGVR